MRDGLDVAGLSCAVYALHFADLMFDMRSEEARISINYFEVFPFFRLSFIIIRRVDYINRLNHGVVRNVDRQPEWADAGTR